MKTIIALLFALATLGCATDDGEDVFDATGTWDFRTTYGVGNCTLNTSAIDFTFHVARMTVTVQDGARVELYLFEDTERGKAGDGDLDCSAESCSGWFIIDLSPSTDMSLTLQANVSVEERGPITGAGQYTFVLGGESCEQDASLSGAFRR